MNDTENKTSPVRPPNGGPGHMRPTGAYPTLPLWEALAARGVHAPKPPPIQPDEATVPTPVDPAHANVNSTHIWPVGNVRPSPAPRPPAPTGVTATGPEPVSPDWRSRLWQLPWRLRVALAIVVVAVLVVAAVLSGVVS